MNEPLKKSYEAKQAAFDGNTLRVVASGTGYPDRYGDVLMPGAFKTATLKDFLKHGWVDVGHEWTGLPVAMPTEAKLSGDELVSACAFHATQRGQEAKTVCEERMAAGMSVSVSIGFMPDYKGVQWFEKGADLLAWARDAGYDESSLDTAAIKKLGYCRAIPAVTELFEWSIVCVGANPRAKAIEMKSGPTPEDFAAHIKAPEPGDEPELDTPEAKADDVTPDAERVAALLRRAKLLPRA